MTPPTASNRIGTGLRSLDHARPTDATREPERATTPWGLWSAAHAGKTEGTICQSTLTNICDESKQQVWVHRQLKDMAHDNFEKKAWFQSSRFSSVWIWTRPKEHNKLNDKQFPVVAQTYFCVRKECLRGLEGQNIQRKSGGGREDRISTCHPYGENLVKATLPGSDWTYHHDEMNCQIHKIIRQSGMVS